MGIGFLLFEITLSYTTKDLFMPRCTRATAYGGDFIFPKRHIDGKAYYRNFM
jgi:hypothetical protein